LKTIGQALAEHRGIGPGFDAMRVILALGVIAWHSVPVVTGDPALPRHGAWWALVWPIVPMFFALSGFLVTGSAMRLPLIPFAASRALRIVPALAVDTLVSILGFGLLFTTLSPVAYLSHPMTLAYGLNSLGDIHYNLPGVFTHAPQRMVNASLWTVPGELCCYITMAALIIARQLKSWPAPLLGVVLIFATDLAFRTFGPWFPMEKQLAGESGKLIAAFLLGSIAYSQRDHIPLSPWLAGAAALIMAAFAAFGSMRLTTEPAFIAIASVALTYLVVWLGLQPLPLPWPFNTGDYSYGVYLYGFPVQQAVVHVTGTRSPLVVFVLTVPLVLGLAAMSWRFVEKPALRLRKALPLTPRAKVMEAAG